MKPLTIGKLAHAAGIGIETIRFYERTRLIPEPARTESGYRQYPEEIITRIRFILRAKELGFSLKEIKELLSLRASPKARCAEIRKRAEAKVNDIDAKVRSLLAMRNALLKLVKQCSGKAPATECPILEALDMEAAS